MAVLITTPKFDTHQRQLCNNPMEEHISLWKRHDFKKLGDCQLTLADPSTYVVAFFSKSCKGVSLRPNIRKLPPLWNRFRTAISQRFIDFGLR